MSQWMRLAQMVALVLVLVLSCFSSAFAGASGQFVRVGLNDRLLQFPDAKAEMINGSTYLPIRYLAQEAGWGLEWDALTNEVTVSEKNRGISLEINRTSPLLTYLKDDRTMVPFRWVSEKFGYEVSYLEDGPVARAKDASAELSDEQFYEKYRAVIEEEKARQEPAPPPLREEPAKVAYLTFDDGPNGYTEEILDILQSRGVEGTFFMLSGQVQAHADIVKRIHAEGHSMGLHGVTHDADRVYASPQAVVNEMNAAQEAVAAVTGVRTKLIRVPYGSKPYMKQGYRDAVVSAGYKMWDWNVDSMDSRAASVPADRIIAQVKQQVSGKDRAVVLFHDKKTTVQALPVLVDWLLASGYELIGLEEHFTPHNFWGDTR
ncbi:polysaccharide deacetylase family protein [Tumebacillus sp. DT12]|uniref:Polysaccharide deacetylase family protein n=1 Tax=Tumebacillus lacus TaxID=2995335 RepID=A0ABT3X4H5_9BACL|nr:polysaccharide deacetylase family protein [Tumebacillus lacus]MCX7571803.1 polysaccharide deacetylase family protein [Tumebacillus lacus]